MRDYLCIAVEESKIVVTYCTEETRWNYDQEVRSGKYVQISLKSKSCHLQRKLLKYSDTDKCLRVNDDLDKVLMAECDEESLYQKWYFTHFNPGGLPYTDLV